MWFVSIITNDFQAKKNTLKMRARFFLSDPAGTRTQDPNIKSVMLYQLSYGIILIFKNEAAKVGREARK